jgi:zinc protease
MRRAERLRAAVAAVGLVGLALAAPARAATGVHEFTLGNGLKVLVKPDRRAPVVVSQIWYRVGSSYESGGITGISHMLEHMMFKGTESYGPGEFSRIVAAEGGRENAFTGQDYTAYFQSLASDRLEVSFKLESDRMANLRLREEDFVKEREVVSEERRLRTEDQPESLTYETFQATAYQTSPYRYPVIGWMADIESYSLEDLTSWYRRWYAPNNATLVVVGDVEPEAVRALAERYFGPIPRADVRPPKPRPEVEQTGPRRAVVKAPAKLPYVILGYKAPTVAEAAEPWEPYAIDVLAAILGGDESARIQRRLVRGEEVASAVGVSYDAFDRMTTLFTIAANPADGRDVGELEAKLLEEVRRVREEPIEASELAKVKTQVVAADVYQLDSVFAQAMRLGRLETTGVGWRVGEEYVSRVRAVTPEQVSAVARKYLTEDRLTVARLDPLPLDSAVAHRPAEGGRHVR